MTTLVPMVTGPEVAFWLLAPVMVLAALCLVLVRRPVHSALCLAVVMICLAVQYAALEAPFLFAVQIIVYTGAILMLFLFVLMLVGVDSSDSLVETIRGQRAWAIVAGIGLAVLLIVAIGNATTTPIGLAEANAANGGNVQGLAALIFHRYVFAFEVTSALLITAAVGAMVLAFRERLTEKKTQRVLVTERMQRYADHGEHPGPLPTPGVFARHNGVDVPALLPDGTPAYTSVGETLRNRGTVQDAEEIAASTSHTVRALTSDETDTSDQPGTPDQTGTRGQTGDEEGNR